VPESSWFVDRILSRRHEPMTAEEVGRGPGDGRGPAPGRWVVLSSKRQGITPGSTVLDANGTYRVHASKALPGLPVGVFTYHGTRGDDPNDVVPHEHRRELRALRVFAAWVNHHDVIAINTLDTLVRQGDQFIVRHHLIDFGSTLGSAALRPRRFDHGHQYAVEPGNLLTNALSFGLHVRPFERVRYRDLPSVGRFSADRFDPERWKPEVPNPAFLRARADDLFWGARRVMAFTDEMIRAAVASASCSDARAAGTRLRTTENGRAPVEAPPVHAEDRAQLTQLLRALARRAIE
jgi:hypothetical protein